MKLIHILEFQEITMAANEPTLLKCPTCGAPLDFDGVHSVVRCKFCGNNSLIPGMQSTGSASALDEIDRLVSGQDPQAAVERYRAAFSVDENEAREAVDAIAGGRMAAFTAADKHSAVELIEVMQKVRSLAAGGRRTEAVALYRETFDASLQQAAAVVDKIAAWNAGQLPSLGLNLPEVTAYRRKTNVVLAVVLPLILIAVIGLAVFAIFKNSRGRYIATGGEVLITSVDGSSQQIAVPLYDPVSEKRLVGLVDAGSGKLLWRSDPVEEVWTSLAAGSGLVYAVNGTHLKALRSEDGTLAWQTELSDKLAYGPVPMLVHAGRVIVNTADQKIAAYEAAGGSLVWSRENRLYQETLTLAGNSLLVRDYLEGSYDDALYRIDPVTGSQQYVLSPTCEAGDRTYKFDNDTGLAYDSQRGTLMVVYEDGCIQAYDLASARAQWTTLTEENFNFAFTGFQYLFAGERLYFDDESSMMVVDLSSRGVKTLTAAQGYDLVPLALSGDTLLVRAEDTCGSTRFELWGVNSSTGAIAWQMNLQEDEPIDPPHEMAGLIDKEDHGWTWHLSSAGLQLITFSGEPNQVAVETFNLVDGTSKGRKTADLSAVSGDFYDIPAVTAWQDDTAIMDVDGILYSLDTTAGKLKKIY